MLSGHVRANREPLWAATGRGRSSVAGRSPRSLGVFRMRDLGLIIILAVAPFQLAAGQLMFPLPEGATGATHMVLASDGAEEDYFWLNEKYPSFTALTHYSSVFSGWRQCYGKAREWRSFPDQQTGEDLYVHLLVRHWVNKANDTSFTLILRYGSKGLAPRSVPDSDRQLVALVKRTRPNAAEKLEEIGNTCEKDT